MLYFTCSVILLKNFVLVHSNPVITNHLGVAKNSYKGESLYPGWIRTEMEFFLASKFALSENLASPGSL